MSPALQVASLPLGHTGPLERACLDFRLNQCYGHQTVLCNIMKADKKAIWILNVGTRPNVILVTGE